LFIPLEYNKEIVSFAILEVEFTSNALVPFGYFFNFFIVSFVKVTPPISNGLFSLIYFKTVVYESKVTVVTKNTSSSFLEKADLSSKE